jgi:hypothetical protein
MSAAVQQAKRLVDDAIQPDQIECMLCAFRRAGKKPAAM